jgi:secreted trypsin-like serine protease
MAIRRFLVFPVLTTTLLLTAISPSTA